mmetsp:Transcript_28652/g.44279  ORF Transcript_28652/g.44279 Transcript_28652/m.44279 type:complete len:619 (+) Transcript_28652:61-1917(+)
MSIRFTERNNKMLPAPSLIVGINKHSSGDMKNNNYQSSSHMKRSSSGLSVSRLSSPKSSPHIVDDIRNDNELMFADDMDQPPEMTLPRSAAESGTPESHLQPPSHRRGSNNVPASRRTSQEAIADLQREVDMALEFFSQEADGSSDDDYMANEVQYLPIHKGGGVRFNMSGDCDDSYPSTAATSLSPSDDFDNDTDNGQGQLISSQFPTTPVTVGGGLSLKHKTKSLISLPLSLLPSRTTVNCAEEEDYSTAVANFDNVICEELQLLGVTPEQHSERSFAVDFESNHSLRNAMEPFLCVARLKREEARQSVFDTLEQVMLPQESGVGRRASNCHEASSFHIGSSYGVPYPDLRNEIRFLYDLETFPLDKVLAKTLGVTDLSKLHLERPRNEDKGEMMSPLRNRGSRRRFHQMFDSFVVSHVIPLLHSQALSKGIFYTNRHQLHRGKPQTIVYRYQAFPSINIVRPGECSTDPHCDMTQGHSIGNISFHIPLTATYATNAVYVESRPGREDWHPLSTSAPGLGFQFDGARCLHFNLKNETDITRVSLNFRVAITRVCDVTEYDPDDQLCCPELLNDRFSQENPGFYDEVEVSMGDVQRSFLPRPVAVKRKSCSVVSIVG